MRERGPIVRLERFLTLLRMALIVASIPIGLYSFFSPNLSGEVTTKTVFPVIRLFVLIITVVINVPTLKRYCSKDTRN